MNIGELMPMLSSLGITPDMLTPEKMAQLEKLAKAFSSNQEITDKEVSKILREIGIELEGGKPKKVPKQVGKKIGRNDKCTCDSGKKYKKCCGILL